MEMNHIDFNSLVSLVRVGIPIEIDGITYVAKKVEAGQQFCCGNCKLKQICEGFISNVCTLLDTPSESYYLEILED